ncbi:unnamed protein product [Macrosiphum euphorbiae]|uniref:Peptidase aspartic putative domain-containing protein n=1 Tax=Macrosiphum euphorbiae TaxID=13131 RepID=A0AAV0VZL3_9HEMI|nr:unnamed protein product [Macrosiphum euphorbiae]
MFMKASVSERQLMVKKSQLCLNCLRVGHSRSVCSMDKVCKMCGFKHHTLLHNVTAKQHFSEEDPGSTSKTTVNNETVSSTTIIDTTEAVVAHGMPRSPAVSSVLLSTALVQVHGSNGRTELCRALLDSASQSHFITSSLATRLGLQRVNCPVTVEGISDASTKMSEMTFLSVSSRISDTNYRLTAIVTPRVTVDLPTKRCSVDTWTHFKDVSLADPNFHVPGRIDLLIGAEVFLDCIKNGKISGPANTPTLQNSKFGWIVYGTTEMQSSQQTQLPSIASRVVTSCAITSLDRTLRNFWELEEVPRLSTMSAEEKMCEEHYQNTHTRDSRGRYVLQLPFKKDIPSNNNSYLNALRRLNQVEAFLSKHTDISIQYKEFMREYQDSNHMEKYYHMTSTNQ